MIFIGAGPTATLIGGPTWTEKPVNTWQRLFVENLHLLPTDAMLRISINESEGNVVTLRLEGQIVGAWISELSGACERMLTAGRTVTLDLGDVSLIDRPGLALLASFSQRGVVLVHCSPFQEAQLRLASSPRSDPTH